MQQGRWELVAADPAKPLGQPPLRVEGEGVLVSSLRPSRDGRATIVRLFAASGKPERITLQWTEPKRDRWRLRPVSILLGWTK